MCDFIKQIVEVFSIAYLLTFKEFDVDGMLSLLNFSESEK